MAEKHYSNDWAKSKSRDMVKSMIERTLLRTKKPSDLYVLCFPGIDATEIHEVYDPLKIPRKNIVGVERDQEVAAELERKNLGIRLVKEELDSYVDRTKALHFDVVSIDYTGPIQIDQVNLLQRLIDKQEKRSWILHHANLARRDIAELGLHKYGAAGKDGDLGRRLMLEEALNERTPDVAMLKGEAYSGIIIMALFGSTKECAQRVQRFVAGDSYEMFLDRVKEEAIKRGLSLDEFDPNDIDCSFTDLHSNGGSVGRFISHKVLGEVISRKIPWTKNLDSEDMIALLNDALQKTKKFVPENAARYSYISESGSPMIGDIHHVVRKDEICQAALKVAKFYGYPGNFAFKFHPDELLRNYVNTRKNCIKRYKDLIRGELADGSRTFLGSSAKPVLTKGRAIELMKQGISLDEIRETHRGWTNKPLSQWKAHVTMGRYDLPREIRENIREDPEDRDIEKITKEEAQELLASGIPPREINETYPTSFTVGQLAAFRAWQTMRARQNSLG